MLIPFLRQIPLLGVLLSLLMAGNSLSQPYFAPFPNFTPSGWSGVVVAADASGRMDVPLLFQFDYPETVVTIDGEPRSVLTSGCGTTSLAMAIQYYHKEDASRATPDALFQYAVDEGMYGGDGLGHTALSNIARIFNLRTEWRSGSESRILRWLREGNLIIAHMNTGMFTENSGHYILLVGATEDGKVLVNDPNSRLMSTLAFPVETLISEGKTKEPFCFLQLR